MKAIKDLLASVKTAADECQKQVEGGEHSLFPVYQQLRSAERALGGRVHFMETSTAEATAAAKAPAKPKEPEHKGHGKTAAHSLGKLA